MRGLLASFVVAVALLAVVSSEASAWTPGRGAQRDRLGSQLEHHRRQAVGAAAMRADERVARLHHPLVRLILTMEDGHADWMLSPIGPGHHFPRCSSASLT